MKKYEGLTDKEKKIYDTAGYAIDKAITQATKAAQFANMAANNADVAAEAATEAAEIIIKLLLGD